MKETVLKSLTAVMAIAVLSAISYAQKPAKRIDFAKDGCCLVWEERIPAKGFQSYFFYAKKGQKLTLSLIDDTNEGSMDLGKVSVEPNADPTEIIIEVSKEYTLTVSNNSSRSTSFRIMVNLEDVKSNAAPSPAADAERLRFPQGAEEMNYEKVVPANGAKRFVFGVRRGQEVGIMITPKNKGVTFDTEFAGKPVATWQQFTMIVDKSGDYMLEMLNASDRNQPFTLDLTISSPTNEPTESTGGEPVKFVDNSANFTRDIAANGSYDFVISAKRGQKLGLQIGYEGRASNIQGYLSEPGLQDLALSVPAESRKEFAVKKTGDHRFTVVNKTGKTITFTLYADLW